MEDGVQTNCTVLYKQLELVHIGDVFLTLKAPNPTLLQRFILLQFQFWA